jgi:hypothetical protein
MSHRIPDRHPLTFEACGVSARLGQQAPRPFRLASCGTDQAQMLLGAHLHTGRRVRRCEDRTIELDGAIPLCREDEDGAEAHEADLSGCARVLRLAKVERSLVRIPGCLVVARILEHVRDALVCLRRGCDEVLLECQLEPGARCFETGFDLAELGSHGSLDAEDTCLQLGTVGERGLGPRPFDQLESGGKVSG